MDVLRSLVEGEAFEVSRVKFDARMENLMMKAVEQ